MGLQTGQEARVCLRCMVMAREHGQLVDGALHQVGVREGAYRVQALGDVVRIGADDVLRGVRVEDDDQQTALLLLDLAVFV